MINAPVRVTHKGGTLTNHFYYINPQSVQNTQVFLSDISDHFPLFVRLKNSSFSKTQTNAKTKFYQDYSKINSNKLLTDSSIILSKFKYISLLTPGNL